MEWSIYYPAVNIKIREKTETELNMAPQQLSILNRGPINKTRFDARTGSARLI